MSKYIIIEDEPAAQRRLRRQIAQIRPDWTLVTTADSVSSGVKAIEEKNFDLIFCDIELSDGHCFQIFEETELKDPIIFITAYDEYAVNAFDFNSVHYLLKPIKIERLQNAIEKFERSHSNFLNSQKLLQNSSKDQIQKKILSKIGNKTRVIHIEEIAFIYYSNRLTKCVLHDGKDCYLDKSLNQIMKYLNQQGLFRINRQVIIAKPSVQSYTSLSSNRLLLTTRPSSPFPFIVSKERSGTFRKWLE